MRPAFLLLPGMLLTLCACGRGGGTWLHPKLAVSFARWLDLKFAIWADLHIDALLRSREVARDLSPDDEDDDKDA